MAHRAFGAAANKNVLGFTPPDALVVHSELDRFTTRMKGPAALWPQFHAGSSARAYGGVTGIWKITNDRIDLSHGASA
jgi:hypothetical protein